MDNKTKIIVLLSIIIVILLLVIVNQNINTKTNKIEGIYYADNNGNTSTIELKKDMTCKLSTEISKECSYTLSDNKILITIGGYYNLMQDSKIYETIPYFSLDLCNSAIDSYRIKQKIDNLYCQPTIKEYEVLIVNDGVLLQKTLYKKIG